MGASGSQVESYGELIPLKMGESGGELGSGEQKKADPARKVFQGKDLELSLRAIFLDSCDGKLLAALEAEKDRALVGLRSTLASIRPYKSRKYRLELRSYRCRKRCPSCPHYRLYAVDSQGHAQTLPATQSALRAYHFYRPATLITPLLQRLHALEAQLLLLHHARRRALRISLDFLEFVQAWSHEHRMELEPPYYWPPEPSGPCTVLPNLALFHANQRLLQAYRALQDQIYSYNALQAHTRYHKTKQGVLGLYLRYWKGQHPGSTPLPQWRLYLRGKDNRWFATDQARYTSLQRPGEPPKKVIVRNTIWFVYRSGNKAHSQFYRRYRLLVDSLEPLRTRLLRSVEHYISTSRKIGNRNRNGTQTHLIKHLGEIGQ